MMAKILSTFEDSLKWGDYQTHARVDETAGSGGANHWPHQGRP